MDPDLTPRQREAYETYQRQKQAYEQEMAAAPNPDDTKPGLWRTLAAAAAGAVGGWNYDRGGMQWGQQMAREISEGPYQRRMNEHLRRLAAQRQGLEVAQDGMQVVDRAENWKQMAAARRDATDARKANDEAKLAAEKLKQAQVYDAIISKQTGGEAVRYPSVEALNADPDAQEKIKAGTHTLRQPAGTDLVYLISTAEARRRASFEDVKPLAQQINDVIAANPRVARERGWRPVTMEEASGRGAANLQKYFDTINNTLDRREGAAARASRGGGSTVDRETPNEKRLWAANKEVWDRTKSRVNDIKKALDNLENLRIREPFNDAAYSERQAQLKAEMAEALNAAYNQDPLMKPESYKQYKVQRRDMGKDKAARWDVVEVKKEDKAETPAPAGGKKQMTPAIAKQFLIRANDDEAKALEMARAEGYE
jgi:hypothetical protein